MPVVASNRTGKEDLLTFYGSAFITDPTGHILQQANRTDDNVVLVQKFDLEKVCAR
jgi:N-carbamoylputrescine amidase